MYIDNIYINKYRRFKDTEIKLGKYLTCLAGHNAVGKSTLLGLLGHCGEYKKSDAITVFGQNFRAHLNEIVKFSPEFDLSGNNLYEVHFKELPESINDFDFTEELSFRAYWAEKKKRYKLVPMKTDKRQTEKKIKWPTYYLGLSRLYPIGESSEVNEIKNTKKLDESDKSYLYNHYKMILSSEEKYTNLTSLSISEVDKKKSIGVSTEHYDYLTNSAGQDNLGQILMSVLSFRKLKEEDEEKWNGGLLLIDEIDATLHPAAQNKLIDFLYKEAKTIGIQVVFTTHSLSLLEHINKKIQHNKIEVNNNIELCYLTVANSILEIHRNPKMSGIYYDLTNTYQGLESSKQILIYSEDEETRWFFNKIMEYAEIKDIYRYSLISPYLKMLKTKIGSNQLLTLLTQDFDYFSQCIFLLDGDVDSKVINNKIRELPFGYNDHAENNQVIVKLPCSESPEAILYDYIEKLDDDTNIFNDFFQYGYSKRSLVNNGPKSEKYSRFKKDREKYKEWFKDNKIILEVIIEHWMKDNFNIVVEFLIQFSRTFNNAAKKNNLLVTSNESRLIEYKENNLNKKGEEMPV
ncbi:AAA family ATPase [Bacillus sp. FSL W7-1346]|uniref:ATP-dependent nuclease n=1 Tax=Bacillus sp. FSL W7-1346 TaxID=2954565 RepID=UPI00315B2BF1